MKPDTILRAVAATEIAIFAQDRDLRYRWVYNAGDTFLTAIAPGHSDGDVLDEPSARYASTLKKRVLDTGEAVRFELTVATPRGPAFYDVHVDVDHGDAMAERGIVGTCVDITERKRREETLKTLLRELSHRSKNLLAIIQSLASQTARNAVTVPEFLVRFRGRIQSLAFSQDIVTDADWRGADLLSLVRTQVERYAPDGGTQVGVDVSDAYLAPTAALYVGLALHELAVNAASYGSLSVPGGVVDIAAHIAADGVVSGDPMLVLTWRERNGPRVRDDRAARFGTSTLERIVPNAVGGSAAIEYDPDGLRYSLRIPATQFERIG